MVRADLEAVRRARRALDELELMWRERVNRMSGLLTSGGDPTDGPGS